MNEPIKEDIKIIDGKYFILSENCSTCSRKCKRWNYIEKSEFYRLKELGHKDVTEKPIDDNRTKSEIGIGITDEEKSMGEAYLELQNKKYDFLKFQSSLGKKILDDMCAGKFPSEFIQNELNEVDNEIQPKVPGVNRISFNVVLDKEYFSKEKYKEIIKEMTEYYMESKQKFIEPITNDIPDKGSRFNEGKLRWSLVDLKYLEGLVQVLMYGSSKYSDYNWQKGLPTLEVYESLMRHIIAWKSGENKDLESGLDHIDHAICNLYFIKWMIANKPSFDTRRTIVPEQEFTEPKYPSENEK